MKDVYIFAIESSCDETSMAIVKNGKEIESFTVLTQMDTHAKFGGVVPEVASRMHTENITMVFQETIAKSSISMDRIDAIAVTYAPGLLGSLLVGVEFAKTLALVYKKPLIAVNHMIGHIYANRIDNDLKFPLLALVVSGGHTDLIKMNKDYDFQILGSTLDDAIGEAFDKVARILGLQYPGGPNVERLALQGQPTYDLPKPLNDSSYNFSFSGLKSSIINLVHNEQQRHHEIRKSDLACSFQTAAVDQLKRKVKLALKNGEYQELILAGGVSASRYLRHEMEEIAINHHIPLSVPDFKYCTDNAAMIGAAAYPLFLNHQFADFNLNAQSNLPITSK